MAFGCGGAAASSPVEQEASVPDGGTPPAEAGLQGDGGGSSGSDGSGWDSAAPDAGGADVTAFDGASFEAGGACALDPAGATFTFHIHNAGSSHRWLYDGCGKNWPIVIDTPGGMLGIGPESANVCGFTCEQDYQGNPQQGCTDCGPGISVDLPAGATVDMPWDRRVYVMHSADPQCVGGLTVSCALGVAVAPASMQAGTLTACTGGGASSGSSGWCSTGEAVAFTLDTTKSEGTVEVP
jgi:hypothetical protein